MSKKIKKFIEEFKEFAFKGNVFELAVAVVIGGAFTSLVDAFTSDILSPIIGFVTVGNLDGKRWTPSIFGHSLNVTFLWGDFVTVLIGFFIKAFIIFLLIKGINKIMLLGKKTQESKPTTKKCTYCLSVIDIKATRCPHCTSMLELTEQEKKDINELEKSLEFNKNI